MQTFTDGQPVYRVTVANRINGTNIARKVLASAEEARAFGAEVASTWSHTTGLALPGVMRERNAGWADRELVFVEDDSRAPFMV